MSRRVQHVRSHGCDVLDIDHPHAAFAQRQVHRALAADRLSGHEQVLHEEVRLEDGVGHVRALKLGIRQRMQAAIDRRCIVRCTER